MVLIMFSTKPPCQSNNSPHLNLYLHETKHTKPDCYLFFNPSSRIQTFKISLRDQSIQLFINMGSFRLGKSLWWATPLVYCMRAWVHHSPFKPVASRGEKKERAQCNEFLTCRGHCYVTYQ